MEKIHPDSITILAQKSAVTNPTKFLKKAIKETLEDREISVVSFKFIRMPYRTRERSHFEIEVLYKGLIIKHRSVGGVNNTKTEHIDSICEFVKNLKTIF